MFELRLSVRIRVFAMWIRILKSQIPADADLDPKTVDSKLGESIKLVESVFQ